MLNKKIIFRFASQNKENVPLNYYFFYYYYWSDFRFRGGIILILSKDIFESLPRNQEAFYMEIKTRKWIYIPTILLSALLLARHRERCCCMSNYKPFSLSGKAFFIEIKTRKWIYITTILLSALLLARHRERCCCTPNCKPFSLSGKAFFYS